MSRILPLKGQNPPGALCLSLPKSYRLSGERPSGYHSLLLRRKMSIVSPSPGRLSPGRKTPPRVSAPSTGLRLLIVSRFKWGRGPYRGHSVIPCAGNTIWLQYSFIKELLEDSTSACRERIVAATRPSPFKVGDNQRPERTMSGVRKPPPESSVPGENLTRGSRRNQLRRGHGSPPVLGEVPHELSTAAHSKECKRSPQQFIPAGFPYTTNFPRGRKTQPAPSLHQTWSVPDASSNLS